MILGDIYSGATIRINDLEFIVLKQVGVVTSVITKDIVHSMEFGESNDYKTSAIREYLNHDFYALLQTKVGAGNIVRHTVNLIADDGMNRGESCEDYVSLITADTYRQCRKYLTPIRNIWWTATPKSKAEGWARGVCCVGSDGVLSWYASGWSCGARPFCYLNSAFEGFDLIMNF